MNLIKKATRLLARLTRSNLDRKIIAYLNVLLERQNIIRFSETDCQVDYIRNQHN
jgi:hypothetical protein